MSDAVSYSVYGWCLDFRGFRSNNHAVLRYQSALLLAGGPPSRHPSVFPIRDREQVTYRSRENIHEEALIAVPAIKNAIRTQTMPPFIFPADLGLVPLRQRYRARKLGNIWVVKFGNDITDVGPGKRRAKTLSRGYNRALRGATV